jgi:glycolate oxidase FAD binding subunit
MSAALLPAALARACSEVRPAGPDDAVAGVAPRYVARPADVAEASAVMQAAAAEGLAAVPRGAGTRLGWGGPPTRCDLIIDTGRMSRVLEHAAGDQVVRVQAGIGLDQLAAVLGRAGQRLALDPPAVLSPLAGAGNGSAPGTPGGSGRSGSGVSPGGAVPPRGDTVGGVLAVGAAGPLRLRYGTPRDLNIGITVVRADGTVASSGGKVVKNVAGYDLGKLFAGSFGTLGLIVEAAFRLHPLPGAASFVTLDCADAAAAHAAIAAAADSPLAPSAAEIDRPRRRAPVRVGVLLEGDPDGVAERAARMTELLGGCVASVSPAPPAWWGRGAAAAGAGTVIRIAFWAAALTGVLRAVDTAASAAGLDPALGGSAAAGVLYAAVDERAPPSAVSEFVQALRAAFGELAAGTSAAGLVYGTASPSAGPRSEPASPTADRSSRPVGPASLAGAPSRASAVVLHAPAAVRAAVDLWGPVPALGLMRAVKDRFDPEHRMAPGRFAGGI